MKETQINAIDLAGIVCNICKSNNYKLDNMSLQRILFGLKRSFLQTGNFLFAENFEAWKTGPVIPCVSTWFYMQKEVGQFDNLTNKLDSETEKRVHNLIIKMIDIPSSSLIAFTQRQGGAWDTTLSSALRVITDKSIAELG